MTNFHFLAVLMAVVCWDVVPVVGEESAEAGEAEVSKRYADAYIDSPDYRGRQNLLSVRSLILHLPYKFSRACFLASVLKSMQDYAINMCNSLTLPFYCRLSSIRTKCTFTIEITPVKQITLHTRACTPNSNTRTILEWCSHKNIMQESKRKLKPRCVAPQVISEPNICINGWNSLYYFKAAMKGEHEIMFNVTGLNKKTI